MTAGQLKRSWISALRAALDDRGFKALSDRAYARSAGDGSDRLLLPLRAMGRGETTVMVTEPAVAVVLDSVEDELAAMKGEVRNPDKVTWSRRLSELVDPDDAPSLEWRIDTEDDIPESTSDVVRFVEKVANPWWTAHHDRAVLLEAMVQENNCRQFVAMETRAVLAHQQGKIAVVTAVLESYQEELTRRGGHDDEAFESNRRWLAVARRTMIE